MSDELLREAVAVAKSGDRRRAVDLTKQYLRQNPKDVRGWWALAKLVDDPKVKMESLKRVLKLDPTHAKAEQMMLELEDQEEEADDELYGGGYGESTSAIDEPAWASDSYSSESGGALYDDPSDDDDSMFGSYSFSDSGEFADEESMFSSASDEDALKALASEKRSSSSGCVGNLVFGLLVVLIIAGFIGGIGYYAYAFQHRGLFGLLGPDLDTVARTNDFTIRYPAEWDYRLTEGNSTMVAATQNTEAWAQSLSGLNLDTVDFLGGEASGDLSINFEEETAVVMMGPVTTDDLSQLRQETGGNYSSFQEYMDAEFDQFEAEAGEINELSGDGFEFKIDVDRQDTTIDGDAGRFSYFQLYMKVDEEFAARLGNIEELNMGVYVATVQHNGTEYVFMLVAIGDNAESHKRTAQRMLRTVEFLN